MVSPLNQSNISNVNSSYSQYNNLKQIIQPKSAVNNVYNKTNITNNKKIIKTAAIAGALVAFSAAFIFLGKKGKLGETCKEFINKFFNSSSKTAPDIKSKTVAQTSSEEVKKYLAPEAGNVKIYKVICNSESVEADVAQWKKLYDEAPELNCEGKSLNVKFNEFEIKPHNYKDDTDVFIHRRDYGEDFASYKLENGLMTECKNPCAVPESTREAHAGRYFEFQPNGRCLQTGHFDDGRKYVTFSFFNGEVVDRTRGSLETVMLVSKDNNFTQSQKDVISIFALMGDRKFEPGKATPLSFATINPDKNNLYAPCENCHTFRTNKNALLSAISSWAQNLGNFDVDDFISKTGDTFRTGAKMDFYGKDMKYLNNF